ncbi:hypothetical protein APR04_004020 [Promicromonospora umidemergens]|uniref:Uncharacterized protein n=1 Tax=Promicromonospora umidemergens TaxID=629679 RepID=A0ABP8X5L7_9MICO|nr:hypothetical protein [Promicromonospora umidemergens]MCP2285093.1 hypothetical protein [Promicromonospora umidemergens]
MSENERIDPVPGHVPSPGPPAVPGQDRDAANRADTDATKTPTENPGPAEEDERSKAIPGEDPEDNPDLEGEERFDAG